MEFTYASLSSNPFGDGSSGSKAATVVTAPVATLTVQRRLSVKHASCPTPYKVAPINAISDIPQLLCEPIDVGTPVARLTVYTAPFPAHGMDSDVHDAFLDSMAQGPRGSLSFGNDITSGMMEGNVVQLRQPGDESEAAAA